MLPCQVTLNENSKYNLTPIFHIMKILMMHERGVFLDVFMWRPLPKQTGNMMWNLLSPLNWFHYGTSNYKSTMQKKRERQGVEVWAFFILQERRMFHSLSPERLIACGVAGLEMKLTISTGMHWHIILNFNCSIWFCEIWARSCSLIISVLICLLFIPMSSKHVAKGLNVLLKPCHRVPKPVNQI